MLNYRSLFLMMLSVVGLTACGPVYKTEYAYIPPAAPVAKMCISQCMQSKMMNEQMCEMRKQSCRAEAREDARYQYEEYKDNRLSRGKRVKKDVNDFSNPFACDQPCDATPSYNACYATCGGQVLERKVCVAFCGK